MELATEVGIALAVFVFGYLVNIFYITVLYHRGLAHGAVRFSKAARFLVQHTGSLLTGIDPKAWACMHRLHHQYSDTSKDPHSPVFQGVMGLWLGQLRSYEKILARLAKKSPAIMAVVEDIDFDVSYLNRKKLWYVPYLMHLVIALTVGAATSSVWIGAAYFLGIMSHPVQGWMVNALAHRYGYRNFNTTDQSRNNTAVAWLVFGEGFQNNHHQNPGSVKFSVKWYEVDLGYVLCVVAARFGLISFGPSSQPEASSHPAVAIPASRG